MWWILILVSLIKSNMCLLIYFPTILIMCMFLYKILHVLCFGIVDVCEDEFNDVSEHVFS